MKKRTRQRIMSAFLALCITASVGTCGLSAQAAQPSEDTVSSGGSQKHVLNAGNNCDISKELIMPGDVFVIEPQYESFHTVGHYGQDVTNCWLYNASLTPGDVSVVSKLVRNTADVSGIKESRTDTYNVFKMAYERGDLNGVLEQIEDSERRAKLIQALQNAPETSVTTGYVNNTNTPIVLQQVTRTSSKSEGVIYGGMGDIIPLAEAGSTHKSDFTIKFYEPYYTISYDDLLEGEDVGLPDRYYIKPEKQEIVLPDLVRPGYHFKEWVGGLSFADKTKVGDTTVLTFDWANNLANAGYNFGDETLFPTFKRGYTVTFNPNGGTIDGEKSAVYELNTKSESFFDIGDYVPEREGYTFAGWCYKASALYDSLIEDTSNYDWMNNTSGYDIQLYAKWAEETDEELETNGFRFDEATGELKIVNDKGMSGWNKLCSSTNGECKAKVKSLYIGGDVTSVGSSLFSDCINLKSVVLADSVKYINSCTFMNCSSLQTVEMSGVTNISNSAFENCSSLRRITFPEKLAYIHSNAFKNCTSLALVKFEKTSSESNLNVGSGVFEQCSPNLVICVDSSLVDKFKEKYMPEYADKIMSDEFETEVIDNIEIVNTVLSYNVGDKPVFTGTVPDNAPYVIDYEGWFGEDGEFISSSEYWNSAYVERGWCDGLISTFKANTEYKYCLYIKLTEEGYNAGYRFGKNTALSVNGEVIDLNPDYVSISEDGGLAQFGYVLTMTPVEEPSFVTGDVNMDGKVNLIDAILVQKNSLGMYVFTEEQLALGDVNKDGYISLIDAIMIQKYALGMITSF